jgi:hypothetical protein
LARRYAKTVKLGTEAENLAVAIRPKAEIRLAETVTEGQKASQIAGDGRSETVRDRDGFTEGEVLPRIHRQRSYRWRHRLILGSGTEHESDLARACHVLVPT